MHPSHVSLQVLLSRDHTPAWLHIQEQVPVQGAGVVLVVLVVVVLVVLVVLVLVVLVVELMQAVRNNSQSSLAVPLGCGQGQCERQ